MGSFQYKSQVNGDFFAYLWVILRLELGQGSDSCHIAVKLEFESVFKEFSI